MPGVTDFVWMGASQVPPDMGVGLMHSDPNDMMLDHDSSFFAATHHSTSNQSLEDMHAHHSPMVSPVTFRHEKHGFVFMNFC